MAEDSENQEYDPANDPNRKAKSDDPAWKYGFWPELTNKDMVQCILCGKRVRSGVKRLKQHLAGTTFGDVTKCPKATKEIREEMQAAMANKKRAPKFQLVDEGDEIQEIEATNVSSTAASNVPSSGTAAKRARASFFQTKKSQDTQLKDKKSIASMLRKSPEDVVEERHRKGPSQTTIEHRTKTKEDWERCADHISNFFYENGIPFNAALSRSYEVMIESIGQYGSGMRPPSYHELRVPQLEKAKKKTDELKKKHENAWTQYGCTLMSDGWNDKRGRHLINFLVNSPEGTFFLGSEDVSSQVQDATMLANLLEKRVETIGKDKVVQIVTDNASNFKAAGRILEARIPGLFWTPCAAHCIDLMLEDIGKLKEFQPTITKARRLTTFIYRHGRLLEAMRRKTKGRDLVRCGATRFATAFLTLQSIFQHKDALRQLFVCDDWMKSNLAPTEMGKKVYATVLSTKFWNSVSDCMKASHPLLIVLRIVDGDEKPAMADISAAMDLARNRIKESFQGGSQVIYNKVAKIINERWANQMDQKLYDAALFLNPGKFFTIKEKDLARAAKIRMMFNDVLEKMVHDDSLVGVISNQANNYQNVRGGFDGNNVVKHRTTMSPLDWWSCYGGLATDLWQFAIRIIGLCCSSSGCERNWSTFDFIHTKKRNRLEHKRLNDLVYVKYNRKMTTRFQKRRAEGKGSDPLVLEDLPWDNEWINVDGDLIDPDAGVWWNTVDVAVGASTDGRPLRGYSRRSRNVSSTSVPYDSDSDEVEEDSMVPMVLDDVDIEDNYGVSSPISNDHVEDEEGFKNFDFGDDYL